MVICLLAAHFLHRHKKDKDRVIAGKVVADIVLVREHRV